MSDGLIKALIIAVPLIAYLAFIILPLPLGRLRQARGEGLEVSWLEVLAMRLRKVNPNSVLAPLLEAHRAGLDVSIEELEAHVLAGGDPALVVDAMVAGRGVDVEVPFARAAAWDLAGRDPLDGVRRWVATGDVPSLGEIALLSGSGKSTHF